MKTKQNIEYRVWVHLLMAKNLCMYTCRESNNQGRHRRNCCGIWRQAQHQAPLAPHQEEGPLTKSSLLLSLKNKDLQRWSDNTGCLGHKLPVDLRNWGRRGLKPRDTVRLGQRHIPTGRQGDKVVKLSSSKATTFPTYRCWTVRKGKLHLLTMLYCGCLKYIAPTTDSSRTGLRPLSAGTL